MNQKFSSSFHHLLDILPEITALLPHRGSFTDFITRPFILAFRCWNKKTSHAIRFRSFQASIIRFFNAVAPGTWIPWRDPELALLLMNPRVGNAMPVLCTWISAKIGVFRFERHDFSKLSAYVFSLKNHFTGEFGPSMLSAMKKVLFWDVNNIVLFHQPFHRSSPSRGGYDKSAISHGLPLPTIPPNGAS